VTIAPPSRSGKIGPGAAPDVQDLLAAVGLEIDQPRQVVELLEVVLIEIGEELARPWLVGTDVEVVDVVFQ
jgi:hypothetical protein